MSSRSTGEFDLREHLEAALLELCPEVPDAAGLAAQLSKQALGENPRQHAFVALIASLEGAAEERKALRSPAHDALATLLNTRRRATTLYLLGHDTNEIGRLLGWDPRKAERLTERGLLRLADALARRGTPLGDGSAESLRKAFQQAELCTDASANAEAIWAAAHGAVSSGEVGRVVDRCALSPLVCRAWRLARRLDSQLGTGEPVPPAPLARSARAQAEEPVLRPPLGLEGLITPMPQEGRTVSEPQRERSWNAWIAVAVVTLAVLTAWVVLQVR